MSASYRAYFNEFRLQGVFHDVVIKVADRLFPCHRVVLASALKYFRNAFASENESGESEKREIELKNINADDFEIVLTHVYGGSVVIDETNVFRLLKLSHHLCLPTLVDLCANYAIENRAKISPATTADIFVFACRCGILENIVCANTLTKLVAENFAVLCENLITLSGPHLLKILGHPCLDRNNFSVVVDFLVNWTRLQSDEGKKMLPDLLDAMKLDETAVRLPKEWFLKAMEALNLMNDANDDADDAISKVLTRRCEEESQSILWEKCYVGALMMGWLWRNTTSLMLKWITIMKF